MTFLGRLALITGGTSGIGKSIAIAFLNSGADVIIAGRSIKKVDTVVAEIKEQCARGQCYGMVLDISNVLEVQVAFENIQNELNYRNIDILVNSAGVSIPPSEDFIKEEENFARVIDTNLKGTYLLSKIVSNYMIEHQIEGNILNIASTSSNRPVTNVYALSKWGIKGLTLGLAKILIKHNIVVNAIAPGPTATPMMKKTADGNISLPNNPTGRFSLPEEISSMAVILTSGIGRQVVGDIVYMGGGSGVITVDDISY